jgi:four helix bundle protein
MASRFRGLVAVQLAGRLADEVHAAIAAWTIFDRKTTGEQLMRAIDSVGANIAESSGRWHVQEKRQLLIIARGSLMEAEYWLARSEARGLLDAGISLRIDEIARALNGLIKHPGA